MKTYLYSLLAIGGMLLLMPTPAPARPTRMLVTDNPAEIQRKAAARERVAVAKKAVALKRTSSGSSRKGAIRLRRAMLVLLGLEERKAVTSPAKLDWQLHLHQKQLKMKALLESRARRRRCIRQVN